MGNEMPQTDIRAGEMSKNEMDSVDGGIKGNNI